MCAYYPDREHRMNERNQELWDAYKFCKAVKSNTINGFMYLPNSLGGTKIQQPNVGLARAKFGTFIRETVAAHNLNGCFLVPVPSKDSFQEVNFRSLNMLRQAVGLMWAARVLSPLRFRTELQPASLGGPRHIGDLRPHMESHQLVQGTNVILVDDIKTSGASLLLAKEKIEAHGGRVQAAIVCGRTTDQREHPWNPMVINLQEPLDFFDDFVL